MAFTIKVNGSTHSVDKTPRAKAVLALAAEKAGWGQ